MAPVGGGVLRWSPVEEKRHVRLATRRGFLKNRERGERVIRANKSTKNPRGCIAHHDGERFESAWLTTSERERCSPKAERGWRAPVWLLGGVGRWRGGLPLGARLGGNGGRALERLELKLRERRMGGGEWRHAMRERTEWGVAGKERGQRRQAEWGSGCWAGPGRRKTGRTEEE
jgi:hypothetical protein